MSTDYILYSRWLSSRDRILAIERLRENHTGLKNKEIKYHQLLEAITDSKTWFFFLFGVSSQVVNGAVSNFASLIIKGFGFSSLNTILLTVPYGFIILVSNLTAMHLQQWIPGQRRFLVAILSILLAIAGYSWYGGDSFTSKDCSWRVTCLLICKSGTPLSYPLCTEDGSSM